MSTSGDHQLVDISTHSEFGRVSLDMLDGDCLAAIDSFADIGSLKLRQTCHFMRTTLSELPIPLQILKICYETPATHCPHYVLVDLLHHVEIRRLPDLFDTIRSIAISVENTYQVLQFENAASSFFVDVAAGCQTEMTPSQSPVRLSETARIEVLKTLMDKGVHPGHLEWVYNHVFKKAFIISCECNQLEVARFLATVERAGVRYKAGGVNNAYACVLDRIESDKSCWNDEHDDDVEMPDFDATYVDMLSFLSDELGLNTRRPRYDPPAIDPDDFSDVDSDDESDAWEVSSVEDVTVDGEY